MIWQIYLMSGGNVIKGGQVGEDRKPDGLIANNDIKKRRKKGSLNRSNTKEK